MVEKKRGEARDVSASLKELQRRGVSYSRLSRLCGTTASTIQRKASGKCGGSALEALLLRVLLEDRDPRARLETAASKLPAVEAAP